jgi:hypothetical protein
MEPLDWLLAARPHSRRMKAETIHDSAIAFGAHVPRIIHRHADDDIAMLAACFDRVSGGGKGDNPVL